MNRLNLLATCVLYAVIASFAPAILGQTSSAKSSKDEREIRAADAKTLKAAQAKDANAAAAVYADDASWLPPNAPLAKGKEAIRAGWVKLLATPGFGIEWQITEIRFSRAHDFAYTIYSYQLQMQDAEGKRLSDRGKDLAVWNKQADGSWKIVADTFNSDLPAPVPAPNK